jgi:uncharacterized protein
MKAASIKRRIRMTELPRNRFGLTERDMETFRAVFKNYPEVKIVHVFGSRAMGNYHLGSDVDLAVMNKGVSSGCIAKMKDEFEESSLPYVVDLVNYNRIEKQEFIDHINRVGVPFYTRHEKIEVL